MESIKRTNLFIVGAEKAGTTFLYKYLGSHENIFVPIIKEPQFFSKDVLPEYPDEIKLWNLPPEKWVNNIHMAYIRDINLYFELYKNATPKHLYLVDASVSYLFSKEAAIEISKFNPNSKIIIILRNPIDRAFSAYKMDLGIGRVSGSFENAIKKNPKYIERGLYYAQVKRYYDNFPESNIIILLYDELKSDPHSMLKNVFFFLSLKPVFINNLEKVNISMPPRFSLLNSVFYKFGIKEFSSKILPSKFMKLIKKVYYDPKRDIKMQNKTYEYLINIFRDDIQKLSQLIKKDLKSWLEKKE